MHMNRAMTLTGWLLVVAGLLLSGCGRSGLSTLTVNVTGWSPADQDLIITPRVDGQVGELVQVPAQQSQFSIQFDLVKSSGVFVDGVIENNGTADYAVGSAFVQLNSGGESQTVDLALEHIECSSPSCSGPGWRQEPIKTGVSLHGVWADATDAWAVGDRGTILHWTANSKVWTQESSSTADTLNAVWGRADKDVWAVGLQGTIVHWDGNKWSDVTPRNILCTDSGKSETCTKLYAVSGNDKQLWVGGSSPMAGSAKNLVIFRDDSLQDTEPTQPRQFEIRSIWVIQGGGWLAGTGGYVEFSSSNSPIAQKQINNNVDLNGIWGNKNGTDNVFWAVGATGVNGKNCNLNMSNWVCNPIDSKANVALSSISGTSDLKQSWAVGEKGTIVAKDSSDKWTSFTSISPTKQNLNSVFAVSGSQVWAVGDNGTILSYRP